MRRPRPGRALVVVLLVVLVAVAVIAVAFKPWRPLRHGTATVPTVETTQLDPALGRRIVELSGIVGLDVWVMKAD